MWLVTYNIHFLCVGGFVPSTHTWSGIWSVQWADMVLFNLSFCSSSEDFFSQQRPLLRAGEQLCRAGAELWAKPLWGHSSQPGIAHTALVGITIKPLLTLPFRKIEGNNHNPVKNLTFPSVLKEVGYDWFISCQSLCCNWCASESRGGSSLLKTELCNILCDTVQLKESKIFWFSRTILIGERTRQSPKQV